MQSYFVNHTEPRERDLRAANIPFEPFRMDGRNGILFDERHLAQALSALSSQVESDDNSSYQGIRILQLRRCIQTAPMTSSVRVMVERWNGRTPARDFEEIAREFAPRFGVREVVIRDNDGTQTVPVRRHDGKLYVHFWASAREHSPTTGHPSRLFGIEIRARWNFPRRISEDPAASIIKDERGSVVGEMIGNNIYIHYPLPAAEGAEGKEIFRRVMTEAVLLRSTPEERAEHERLRQERLQEEMRSNPVVVNKWLGDDHYRRAFIAVANEFVPIFGKQIRIYNYCGAAAQVPPIDDGRLHICIWASPGSTEHGGNLQHESTLFDAPLVCQDTWECILAPRGDEGQLLADEAGNQVGKLIRDTVYIHYPLCKTNIGLRWNNQGPEALFRRILEEVVFWKTASEAQKSARARAIAARERAQSREEYIHSCNGRFNKALESTRKAMREGPARVRQLQEELTRKIREVNGLQRKLEQMESCQNTVVETYGKEFDKLLEIPKIRDVRVQNGTIRVFTDTLYCVDPRTSKKHEIGHFRIEIHPGGSVRWFNLVRQVNGMQAPHVFGRGDACLGNMDEVIPELAANYEYAALAMICIQFVESVNVSDEAGARINQWPEAAA